jgi:hypothetical protein
MSRFFTLVLNDFRILHRTGYVWATVAIFAVLLFVALQVAGLDFEGFAKVVAAIILLDVVLTPVLVVGLMILLELGQGSFAALAATPLSRTTYLAARTATVSLIGAAEMSLLAVIAYDGSLSVGLLLLALLSIAAIASISATIIVSPFRSLYPFMVPMFGWILFLGAPAYGVLFDWNPAWLIWHPTAPAMTLLQGAFEPVSQLWLAYGVAGTAGWLLLLGFAALRALRSMQFQSAEPRS